MADFVVGEMSGWSEPRVLAVAMHEEILHGHGKGAWLPQALAARFCVALGCSSRCTTKSSNPWARSESEQLGALTAAVASATTPFVKLGDDGHISQGTGANLVGYARIGCYSNRLRGSWRACDWILTC